MTDQKNPPTWLIFQNSRLLTRKNTEALSLFSANEIIAFKPFFLSSHQIINDEHSAIYCAEVPAEMALPSHLEPLSLRDALERWPKWYGQLTRAHAVLNWDKNHQFCGRCATKTERNPRIFERTCPNCGLVFYPRISPSIIVRITRGDKILMARGRHFPPGAFALIAGFVDAGESVEEAVHREVEEEVGLKIKNLRYISSQQWPFPDSLMLGFAAEYASGEIHIDPTEIEAADWYDYHHLPGRPTSSISIAAQLIDDFVREQIMHHHEEKQNGIIK